jgi:NTE family protein
LLDPKKTTVILSTVSRIDMFGKFKLKRNPKIGLALGGGGAKGGAHVAVLEYLEDMGVRIDMIAGSSIGALIGAAYCCGNLQKLKTDALKMKKKNFLMLVDPAFPRSGLVSGLAVMPFLSEYIPSDVKIEDLDIKLGITATDYSTGYPVILQKGNLLSAVRASISIPGIFVPVIYNNTVLIDGGVAMPTPVDALKTMGADLTIGVNLHAISETQRNSKNEKGVLGNADEILLDWDDHKKINHKSWHWLKSVDTWIKSMNPRENRYPNIFEIVDRSISIMSMIHSEYVLPSKNTTVLIEPAVSKIRTLDFHELAEAFKEGQLACMKVRADLENKIMNRM